ncbi:MULTISPECIES: hypothetical protein [Streptomyces]|uniref:Uncharacterized protein n=2 Tax=Streptomyces TaxID=1883 RepID=A0ABU4KHQ4_9ACTN|nr:hypothetical protein [Streptomyces roseolus]MDX2296815.1 hypothetical protein [Streptomyces roseolus]
MSTDSLGRDLLARLGHGALRNAVQRLPTTVLVLAIARLPRSAGAAAARSLRTVP